MSAGKSVQYLDLREEVGDGALMAAYRAMERRWNEGHENVRQRALLLLSSRPYKSLEERIEYNSTANNTASVYLVRAARTRAWIRKP